MQNSEFEIVEEVNIKRRRFYLVRKDGEMGLLTSEFKVRIPVEWDEIKIDTNFQLKDFLYIPAFYSMYNERNETAVIFFVRKNKHWGVMDHQGETIIPAVYETIEMVHFSDMVFFKVTVNGREGLICLNKNILVPVKWERILPVDLSIPSACPPFLWARGTNYLFCFKSFNNLKNGADLMGLGEEWSFRFVIYNWNFKLITPEALDGYAIIESGYSQQPLVEYLLRKENCYGVLSIDPRPNRSFSEAMELIRKKQKIDYIVSIIEYIKSSCKKINAYFEQSKKAAPSAASKTQNQKKNHQASRRELITKDEIRKMTINLADMLTDLKAFKLAEGARKMEALIENENHQVFLTIIGDLLEWLQSLKVNPELTFENRSVIEKVSDQDLKPEYNRGFAEAILNSESESQKECS